MLLNRLLEEISSDISWRTTELKRTKLIYYKVTKKEAKFILKATLPTIYGHWEGFITSTTELVFKYLNEQELSANICNIDILTTSLEQSLKSLDDSKHFEKKKEHLKNLLEGLRNKVEFGAKIDTKSNLNYKVLEIICKKLNLDIDNFQSEKVLLNELVRIRNSISHGENTYSFVSFKDIEKYINLLEKLMNTFFDEITKLLEEKKYLNLGYYPSKKV